MKNHSICYLIIGIVILVAPTLAYLIWLVPQLSERYQTLLASGGVIAGTGMYSASAVPERWKYASLFKFAVTSFTMCTAFTVISEFAKQILVLMVIFIVSFVVFKILVGVWHSARRRKENGYLAKEIARNIDEGSK